MLLFIYLIEGLPVVVFLFYYTYLFVYILHDQYLIYSIPVATYLRYAICLCKQTILFVQHIH